MHIDARVVHLGSVQRDTAVSDRSYPIIEGGLGCLGAIRPAIPVRLS
jgi:hypothetical protein